MAGWTNKGKYRLFDWIFRSTAAPTNFYVALVTAATAPGADTNLMSDLTQVANGNGYVTGGVILQRNSTDFDTLTEDDANDKGRIYIKDVSWTAAGGPIPSSGSGARYAVLTDDAVSTAAREVYCYWSLGSVQTLVDGETLTLSDLEMDGNET